MAASNGYHNGKNEENLSGKKLKTLPPDLLKKGQNVIKLNLEKNRLKDITGLAELSKLIELNLSRNELTEFPLVIKNLQHLVRLYLNQNNIRSIPNDVFPSLGKLQFLKMNTNRLVQLPEDINTCKRLTYLNLSNNNLESLQHLEGLSNLKELYVEKNHLTELPRTLFETQCLEKLKASGNPLRMPPEAICAGGLKEILNYFVMLKGKSIDVCTIKTMFLGSTMAGKSTLSRSLKLSQPVEVAEADRTIGIEISKVDRDGVCFHFWDFAGQEEYYFTHHVFITAQALVILVIDLSSYDIDDPKSFREKVSFWINNILLKVPSAAVLLVGTHVDECCNEMVIKKKKDIEDKVQLLLLEREANLEQQRTNLQDLEDQSMYKEQISHIERLAKEKLKVFDLIPIDSRKSEDITKLQAHIHKVILNEDTFPFLRQTLPECFKDVETAIQKLLDNGDIPQHGIVNPEEISCQLHSRFNELNHDMLKSILQYLHRIGVILWYNEIPDLKETMFVKPSFLISLFKAIVRHDLVAMLEEIPLMVLKSESALAKHRKTWIKDFTERATLSNVAIRILVREELKRSGTINPEIETCVTDDKDLIEEIVGTKKKAGNLLTMLQHFEVCLPTSSARLNPSAPEFCPSKKWEPSNPCVYEPNGACLFPGYLKDNSEVTKMWGEDSLEDIHVQIYFLPEIPHGFFHRLLIKMCSFYSTYWIGKDQCLFSCGNRRVLIKKQTCDGDNLLELRSKHSDMHNSVDIQKAWDMIKVIMSRLAQLTEQWRGLCQYVHSPCRERGCENYFEWRDWQDWLKVSTAETFNMDPELKMTCRNGHTRRTELLFPVRVITRVLVSGIDFGEQRGTGLRISWMGDPFQ